MTDQGDRGVAPVIGFILLFGIVIIGLASAQAVIVPNQAAATSQEHWQAVNEDMSELRETMDRVADQQSEGRVSIELGRALEDRPLLVEGVPPHGTLATTPATVTIVGDNQIDPSGGNSLSFDTRYLVYNGSNPDWVDVASWIGPVATWDRQGDALTSIENPGATGPITILAIRGDISRASASSTELRVTGVGVSCADVVGRPDVADVELTISPGAGQQTEYNWAPGTVRRVCIKTIALGSAPPGSPVEIGDGSGSGATGFGINPTGTLQLVGVSDVQSGGGNCYVDAEFNNNTPREINLTQFRAPFTTEDPPGASGTNPFDTVEAAYDGYSLSVDIGEPFTTISPGEFEIGTANPQTIRFSFPDANNKQDLAGGTFAAVFRTERGDKLIYFVTVPTGANGNCGGGGP